MNYKDSQNIISNARLNRYLVACNGNKARALQLYRCNIRLSQRFFGVICIFEVMLRNALNSHYMNHFGDPNWIIHQTGKGHLLQDEEDTVKEFYNKYNKKGVYSNDKMVASFMFGFWTYLFTKRNYANGGKTLLQVFPNRAKNTQQKMVYKDLTAIREFRNRIAHHEPICFDSANAPSEQFAETHYQLIKKYISYMGYQPDNVLSIVERPDEQIKNLKTIASNK